MPCPQAVASTLLPSSLRPGTISSPTRWPRHPPGRTIGYREPEANLVSVPPNRRRRPGRPPGRHPGKRSGANHPRPGRNESATRRRGDGGRIRRFLTRILPRNRGARDAAAARRAKRIGRPPRPTRRRSAARGRNPATFDAAPRRGSFRRESPAAGAKRIGGRAAERRRGMWRSNRLPPRSPRRRVGGTAPAPDRMDCPITTRSGWCRRPRPRRPGRVSGGRIAPARITPRFGSGRIGGLSGGSSGFAPPPARAAPIRLPPT